MAPRFITQLFPPSPVGAQPELRAKPRAVPASSHYTKWATDDADYVQVGSIYSVQGFGRDYIGTIFGDDLVRRHGHWTADIAKNKDAAVNAISKAAAPVLPTPASL